MTAPAIPAKAPTLNTNPRFGAPAPPNHRTTALQSAVAVLRGRAIVETEEVLDMAEAFYQFLKKS